ncbi:MAG: diguanylate cyclase [Thermoanaerobaculia bacterium]|nr:diguanylate cyclase [Thermoanaerobaculia bacterium]
MTAPDAVASEKGGIGQSIYPLRVICFFLAGSSVYLARADPERPAGTLLWMVALVVLVYPHLAFLQYSARPARSVELTNLLVDMFLIGWIAHLVYFKPAVALCYAIGNSATNYSVRGVKLVVRGLLALLLGSLSASVLLGFRFVQETHAVELLPAFAYLAVATHYIGFLSYVRGKALLQSKEVAEDLAYRDGLTQIANRRSFDTALMDEWQRCLARGTPLSLILLDIDHFKAYNYRYGHPAGDDCLRRVAAEIAGTVSHPGDLVARFGGEEFGVLLPGADAKGAMLVAHRVLNAVRSLGIRHEKSDTSPVVTVSIGVATVVPTSSFTPRGLILAADQALYSAKESGRDRIVGHRDSESPLRLPHARDVGVETSE